MTDKGEEAIRKGRRAESLLKNEAFTDAVKDVKDGLIDVWKLSTSVEDRERIWLSVQLVDQVVKALVSVANNGKITAARLEKLIQS